MTRIFNIFAASALAVLPISAFAQQDSAPVKTAVPNSVVSPMASSQTPPGSNGATAGTTAKPTPKVTQAAKPDDQIKPSGGKTEVHGMNAVRPHNGKTNMSGAMKSTEPSKS